MRIFELGRIGARILIPTAIIAMTVACLPAGALANEFVVYSVYRGVDLGNPGEAPEKDFYVNMGTAQGVREGTTLEVMRRMSTYDLLSEKLYKDVTFPIARLKVIHSEGNAAIARLEKLLPADKTPTTSPRAVMVGDVVRLPQ